MWKLKWNVVRGEVVNLPIQFCVAKRGELRDLGYIVT